VGSRETRWSSSVGPPGISRFDLIANGLTVAVPIAMAYAVLKHRVLDIRVVIRRGVQYLLARRALQGRDCTALLRAALHPGSTSRT
jgi:hypothetical protein